MLGKIFGVCYKLGTLFVYTIAEFHNFIGTPLSFTYVCGVQLKLYM